MDKNIIKQWEENKHKLEAYLRDNKQGIYSSYEKLVKLIFSIVVTEANSYHNFDYENIVTIDHGDYQGTELFIIPTDAYQPEPKDYYFTHTYYGSCSGCDTLMGICDYEEDINPNEDQLKEYMTLCLHIVQKTKKLIPDVD